MKRLLDSICIVLLSAVVCACRGPSSSRPQQQPIPVDQFVQQVFLHGVPFAEASRYGLEAVPVLLRMLKNPEMEPYWANIVVTLGMIGNPLAVPGIVEFIEHNPENELSSAHYMAKTSAIMALGYLNHQSGNRQCINYLNDFSKPSFWSEQDLQWSSPFQTDPGERDEELARMGILGLALAGNEEADQALLNLKESQNFPEDRAFLQKTEELLDEAIHTCRLIGRKGLAQYYEDTHH